MFDLHFLKLGGSLLTDKAAVERPRSVVLARLAAEIQQALATAPSRRLVLGHGSGSFGHVAAARHQTRDGVHTPVEWLGFAAVSAAAARLNRLVVDTLLDQGVPAISLQPSSSAQCVNGEIVSLATTPITGALDAGLVPLLYGDVAFDAARGGTIISTEEILVYLVKALPEPPAWLLLAGETEGVLDQAGRLIRQITPQDWLEIAPALGGSRGTDVTGGMATKVEQMLALVAARPALQVRVFSGLTPGQLAEVLCTPEADVGTRISSG